MLFWKRWKPSVRASFHKRIHETPVSHIKSGRLHILHLNFLLSATTLHYPSPTHTWILTMYYPMSMKISGHMNLTWYLRYQHATSAQKTMQTICMRPHRLGGRPVSMRMGKCTRLTYQRRPTLKQQNVKVVAHENNHIQLGWCKIVLS